MRSAPLYRSVNTRTHGARHGGGDFRHERGTKEARSGDSTRTSMRGGQQHGRDYTPLFRFLLSRVGGPWAEIYSEAKRRLDTVDPVFWLVARTEADRRDFVRIGESSYFSGLFIDEAGLLQLVNPRLRPENMKPSCTCCTHTLNGVRFPVQSSQGGSAA
jgi:hypothetical protein